LPIHEPVGSRHVLAYVDPLGRVEVADTDTHARLWRVAAAPGGVRALSWSQDGRRLLVRGRTGLRVFAADGAPLTTLSTRRPVAAAAFKPRSHELAYVVGATVLLANGDGSRAAARPVFAGAGAMTGLTWSPDGRWLLVGWRSADQWLFIRSAAVKKIVAVSNVSREFSPGGGPPSFPRFEAWCCAP
jgi:hypothetical protein